MTTTQMQTAIHQIVTYLAQQVSDEGFPARTFYGESFALWLFQHFPGEFDAASATLHPIAQQQLHRQDVAAHPEFNAWAWFHIAQHTNTPRPPLPMLNNTPNSNWLLLGTFVRLLWNPQAKHAQLRRHTRLLLATQQQSDGLIRDDRLISRRWPIPFPYGRSTPTRLKRMPHLQKLSLQYHCFSLLLLQEIWQLTQWSFVQTAVQRGHQAIGRFILENGDTLYLGRGQQQIFGYGALLLFLATQVKAGNQAANEQFHRVWQFVSQFQQPDGRFPLVLREGEAGYPTVVDTRDPRWLGWYGYNNLFDYLPFFGVMLARAAQLLPQAKAKQPSNPPPQSRPSQEVSKQFAFVRQPNWQMSLAAPSGSLSQDQPMPYLCLYGQSILPCFGGEEGSDQPYNLTMLPLPYLGLTDGRFHFLRHAMKWQFQKIIEAKHIALSGRCRWATLRRIFNWDAQKITIQDTLTFVPKRMPANVQTIYPLVFTAFKMNELENGRFQLTPSLKPLYLRLDGQIGKLTQFPGYTPVGAVQVLREAVAWRPNSPTFQRSYTLSWDDAP